jgi:flagellar L-ring protein precursor FlgH
MKYHTTRQLVFAISMVCYAVCAAETVFAQDSSLLLAPAQSRQPLMLEDGSFLHRELPPEARPRELQLHDIITVIVDYRTLMRSEGDAQNRKNSFLTAILTNWIRLDDGALKPALQNDGDPGVSGTYNSQFRAQSDVELRDALTFNIAAEIVEVRPNGNLYVEGDINIKNNEEHWRIFLSGEVRREAIQPDRTVMSKSLSHLDITKEETGQVRDGYSRGWLGLLYDKYRPF